MQKVLSLLSALLLCPITALSQNDGDDVVIGKYHVINSKILGEDRRILVHLPLGYEETNLQYPVVFHLYGDFITTYFADAVSVIERLHDASKMPQVILIGVDNTDRYRDLRPVKADGSPGGADNFVQYFKDELIPYIKDHYRTTDYNILIGPQAGACFGLYALTEHTDLFDAFLLENSFDNPPQVDKYLLSGIRSFFHPDKSVSKFLFMKLKKESSNLEVALEQKATIEANIPRDFIFEFKLNESEDDLIPNNDIKYGLNKLFSEYELPDDIIGLENIKKYYQGLSEKAGFTVNVSDRILTTAGDKLKRTGNMEETRRIFEYILELYPRSLDGLFQVAELNLSSGRYEDAKRYYAEFLKIRPQEAMIQYRLKSVENIINLSAAYEIEQAILSEGLTSGQKVFQKLKSDTQTQRYFNENEFIQMGYRFLNLNRFNEAIEIFIMSGELYPESYNTWDSLGEAYMNCGDTKNALRNYKKSLDINPENSNAREMLKRLEKQ
ncbi:MAG TPA: alpha/beta hydrolase-fold protein [Bacteroidales bacterium]|nr:alpha/beta hydrolase-fold protein [Bacteroidales bacterium]